MLYQITLTSFFLFCIIYPLSFWISFDDPLKEGFHRFHIGLPTVLGSVLCIFLIRENTSAQIEYLCYLWLSSLIISCIFYWGKEFPSCYVLSITSLIGLITFLNLIPFTKFTALFSLIIGSLIFTISLFAMNLGHWYLNVHGLNHKHLRRSILIMWYLVGIRFIFNIYQFITAKIMYGGDNITILKFVWTTDGFLLLIALLFGTLFPLFSLYFGYNTLKLKNTQATTGILYVILCSVIIGDLTYKYYLFKYGIFL